MEEAFLTVIVTALAVLVAASGHANTTWLKTALSSISICR
jgi:hypothetical protein